MGAAVASGVLLLLTVGMAAGLIRHKSRPIELGQVEDYPAGRLRSRLPAGWQGVALRHPAAGVVVGAAEPGSGSAAGRSVFLFRSRPAPMGLASRHAAAAAAHLSELLNPGQHSGVTREEPARMGAFPAWTVELEPVAHLPGAQPAWVLARAALAPGGQIVGAALRLPHAPGRADHRLLDELGASLELLDAPVAADPAEVMRAAGIGFPPPPDARFVREVDLSLPRVRMMGGDGPATWYLDVYRVPLIGPRTPAQLVEDGALSLLEQADLAEPLTRRVQGGREVVGTELAPYGGDGSRIVLSGVRIDDRTALLMTGRCEADGTEGLRAACRAAAAADVGSYDQLLDIAKAQRHALSLLEEITSARLDSAWGGSESPAQAYRIAGPSLSWGSLRRTYRRSIQDQTLWWVVQVEWEQEPVRGGNPVDGRENWVVRNDAARHLVKIVVGGPRGYVYEENRAAGAGEVQRELRLVEGGSRKDTVSLDAMYACEPVLLYAAGRVARAVPSAPAVFNATEPFARGASYWIVVPMGEARPPGGAPTASVRAVRVQRDYDPAPITLYYDGAGVLVAAEFDHGAWQELTSEDPGTEGGLLRRWFNRLR